MRSAIEEALAILERSPGTQWALLVAVVLPTTIFALGAYASHRISFGEPYTPFTEPFRDLIIHRYVEAAFGTLILATGNAVGSFKHAKKRLLA